MLKKLYRMLVINSEINGIHNTHFFAGDMKEVLSESFYIANGKPDVIITDPPRAGMHEDVIKIIISAAPDKIVYISCNPATQSRDIQLLSEYYYITACTTGRYVSTYTSC